MNHREILHLFDAIGPKAMTSDDVKAIADCCKPFAPRSIEGIRSQIKAGKFDEEKIIAACKAVRASIRSRNVEPSTVKGKKKK